ncbi:hypothetical protein [Streptomyces tremellae]|uniref:Uncharacterized protein n=1 Tax=Streptomyces tremellae TaxID=1124239 RepID=A0ABP7EE13_9ACTN
MPENFSSNPQLSARASADWLSVVLRVDQIRTDTLVQLVQHWADPDSREDVIAQLDALAEALAAPREGELDALVEHVEDAAAMDAAETRMTRAEAWRLAAELGAAARRSPIGLPVQRDRRAS